MTVLQEIAKIKRLFRERGFQCKSTEMYGGGVLVSDKSGVQFYPGYYSAFDDLFPNPLYMYD